MQQNAQNGIFSLLGWRNFGGIKYQSSVYSQFNTYSSKKTTTTKQAKTNSFSPQPSFYLFFIIIIFASPYNLVCLWCKS